MDVYWFYWKNLCGTMPYCTHHAQTYWNYNSFCGGIFPLLRTEYIYIYHIYIYITLSLCIYIYITLHSIYIYTHTYVHIYIYIYYANMNIYVPSGNSTELWKITMFFRKIIELGWAARWRCPHWKWKVGAPQWAHGQVGKVCGAAVKTWHRGKSGENLVETGENLENIWKI